MNQDPIGLKGDFNVYQFAPNAQGWVDPLGLFGFTASNTSVGTCNKPEPKCPPDVYAKLNDEVHKAKKLAGQLGGCKSGMGIYEIKQRMMAWKGLAIARSRREKNAGKEGILVMDRQSLKRGILTPNARTYYHKFY